MFSRASRLTDCAVVLLAGCVLSVAAQAPDTVELKPEPFFEVADGAGFRIVAGVHATNTARPVFSAVNSEVWPPGLVPIFAVRKSGLTELRRMPPRGEENVAEPLFFALPPLDETNAALITGRWLCEATNAHGQTHSPQWELTTDGERVAGRFDPHGEYRVALVSTGSFVSNRLELVVEFSSDRYVLKGTLQGNVLSGTWRQHDDADHGRWVARRARTARVPATAAMPLFEWRKGTARRYSTDTNLVSAGWQRSARPLCQVWP
jgi:hypothetical protein